MFWGLIIQERRKYSQVVSKPFRVTQAVLEVSSTTHDAEVPLILTNHGVDYILCILKKSDAPQFPLKLVFSKGDEISFFSVGGTVHLSGYVEDDSDANNSEEEP